MYATANLYQSYQQNGVMTAGPAELIIMLYDAAIKDMKLAKYHIEEKQYELVNTELLKAQNIFAELMSDLDMRYEISNQLLALYDFMQNEVMDANLNKDASRLDPVISMMEELKDAWKTAKGANAQMFMRAEQI